MKVYEVKVDWALDDCEFGCDTLLYSTEEKARKAFLKEIESAKIDYNYPYDNYVVEESNGFWQLYRDGEWTLCHCCITLTEKEVL